MSELIELLSSLPLSWGGRDGKSKAEKWFPCRPNAVEIQGRSKPYLFSICTDIDRSGIDKLKYFSINDDFPGANLTRNTEAFSALLSERGFGKAYSASQPNYRRFKISTIEQLIEIIRAVDEIFGSRLNFIPILDLFDKLLGKDFIDPSGEDLKLEVVGLELKSFGYIQRRDSRVTLLVKSMYECECQVCGRAITKADGNRYAEAHHIWPLGEGGKDEAKNIIVVCPHHHVLLDLGLIPLKEDVILKNLKPGHAIAVESIAYHNRKRYFGEFHDQRRNLIGHERW